jgi:DNA-binding CsgD family transcriptional regulator
MTEENGRLRLLLVVALALIVVAGTTDLVLDDPDRWLSPHKLFEATMIVGALGLAVTLWLGWWRAERSLDALQASLEARSEERDAWRESAEQALEGLGEAIGHQFEAWRLTPAEREVALLLLKGYSHKAIARLTERSAQTSRQHAAAVYEKSGLGGRAQLSAFFLEDLILPDPERRRVQARHSEP